MTAKELYTHDPGFRGFLAVWKEQKLCPLQLVDYLLDRDMYGPAGCARWASDGDEWDNWEFGGKSGRMPWYATVRSRKLTALMDGYMFRSSATKDGDSCYDRAHRFPLERVDPNTPFVDGTDLQSDTFDGVIVQLMDAWRVPVESEVHV